MSLLLETFDPPDVWTDISQDVDNLVQTSKPLDVQKLVDLVELPWSPLLDKLLEEGTRIASGAIMRREKYSCSLFGRSVLVKIPPNYCIKTRDKQILVFIPLATLDGGGTYNTPKEVDLSARPVSGGSYGNFIKAKLGSVNVGFENAGTRTSNGCYGVVSICKKEPS